MMSRLQALLAAGHVRRLIIVMLVAGMLPALWMDAAVAASIKVKNAETLLADKVYHLNADVDYQFSGVALVVVLEIEINRQRDYLWSENIASLRQRYQLMYEALTGRYVVTNLNSGADAYYPTRAAAIAALGDVDHVPLLDAGLIDDRQRYMVALHVSLDLDALPVPMRVMGYFSSDRRLSSEWNTKPKQKTSTRAQTQNRWRSCSACCWCRSI